jgi:lysophospholipase L1-like esterase
MTTLRDLVASLTPLLLALLSLLPGSAEAQTSNPFEGEIRAFEASDLGNPPPTNSILFVGSSSFRLWRGLADAFPDYKVLNRGFGGSQTSDALFFFDRVVLPYRPPLILFYEGDNDLAGGKSVDTIFADWTNFVGRVQTELPDTHLMFVSVKPSPSRVWLLAKAQDLNGRVRDFCRGVPRLRFIDVATPMLNDSGLPRPELFQPDMLHVNAAGYALWTSVIGPVLDSWSAANSVSVKKPVSNGLLVGFDSEDVPVGLEYQRTTVRWNNVTPEIGANDSGVLTNVLAADGEMTDIELRMISRFNAANESGTVASTLFPATATRDSLYGNTESVNGLTSVAPAFRLTGLQTNTSYRLTFYASRMSAGDNRETRYTVTGTAVATADLDPAGNEARTVSVAGVLPDENGEITVALAPGPNNDNAFHLVYLGILRVDATPPGGVSVLFDFGAAGSPTEEQIPTGPAWNELPSAVAEDDAGQLAGLISTNRIRTGIALRMVSRFRKSTQPIDVSDETETTNVVAVASPVFKLTGLDPAGLYTLTFKASRRDAARNRATRYTVSGTTTVSADLDAEDDLDRTVMVSGIRPGPSGEIRVVLASDPNGGSTNRLPSLGAIRLDWVIPPAVPPKLKAEKQGAGSLQIRLSGTIGRSYRLQQSTDLQSWETIGNVTLNDEGFPVDVVPTDPQRFYRLAE